MNETITSNQEIRKEARKRFVYQHLSKRKYATPKGYRPFDDVITIMSINIELTELGLEVEDYQWMWFCAVDVMARAAVENVFPVFRVEADLLGALLEAEDPKPFKDTLPIPFESGLFLFPKDMIRVGKWAIDWLLVDTVERKDAHQTFELPKENILFDRMDADAAVTYRWVTQPESGDREAPGDLFVSSFGYTDSGRECGVKAVGVSDKDFTVNDILNRLTKNLLMWLYQPRELEYEIVEVTRAAGFGRKATATPLPTAIYPIKLGLKEQPHKIYRPRDDRLRDPTLPPRRSPRKHERRSHWRNVPVGKRDAHKRELRLILKTKVNYPKD